MKLNDIDIHEGSVITYESNRKLFLICLCATECNLRVRFNFMLNGSEIFIDLVSSIGESMVGSGWTTSADNALDRILSCKNCLYMSDNFARIISNDLMQVELNLTLCGCLDLSQKFHVISKPPILSYETIYVLEPVIKTAS